MQNLHSEDNPDEKSLRVKPFLVIKSQMMLQGLILIDLRFITLISIQHTLMCIQFISNKTIKIGLKVPAVPLDYVILLYLC